uniref:hypothetical protein n=1 Tax=Endozoicomonas sp. ONNA1 TaxID=2828740 RepID=UPI0021493DAE
IHSFAEYYDDKSQTWKSVDLSGAPVKRREIDGVFQPSRNVSSSSTEIKKHKAFLKDLMKGADLPQQQTLAKACNMSLGELNKALEKNSALPDTRLIISKIVKNLWEEKDLASFSMAVSIIVSLGKEASGYDKEPLEPISEAVKQILSDSDGEQVTEQLKLLHPKMTGQSDSAANRWLRLMAEILEGSDPKPSVIRFALEVLELLTFVVYWPSNSIFLLLVGAPPRSTDFQVWSLSS